MEERTTQVTVMVQFEQTIDIPVELQKNEDAINELADEMISSDEILQNCTDAGVINRITVQPYESLYEELEQEQREMEG